MDTWIVGIYAMRSGIRVLSRHRILPLAAVAAKGPATNVAAVIGLVDGVPHPAFDRENATQLPAAKKSDWRIGRV
jgi:hypothetical protein